MGEDHISAEAGRLSGRNCNGELCASLLQGITDAVFICDTEGHLLLFNPAFARLFKTSEPELLENPQLALRSPELSGIVLEQNAAVVADGRMREFEILETDSGNVRTFLVTKGRCKGSCGRMDRVFGIVREITESRAVEQELIDTSDREKQRLGQELRENFCQHLVGISLLGNVLYEELSRAGLEQARFARQIAWMVKEVVSEVRTLEKGLSVIHLEQGNGLIEALRDLAEQTGSASNIECRLEVPSSNPPMKAHTAMYLFRIAQEAVHNALRRSQASRLLIRLSVKRNAVVLSVRDDGGGFSKDQVSSFEVEGRIGFPLMHHRSRAIGAKLEIKHLRRGGVEVICTVPQSKNGRRRRGTGVRILPASAEKKQRGK